MYMYPNTREESLRTFVTRHASTSSSEFYDGASPLNMRISYSFPVADEDNVYVVNWEGLMPEKFGFKMSGMEQ